MRLTNKRYRLISPSLLCHITVSNHCKYTTTLITVVCCHVESFLNYSTMTTPLPLYTNFVQYLINSLNLHVVIMSNCSYLSCSKILYNRAGLHTILCPIQNIFTVGPLLQLNQVENCFASLHILANRLPQRRSLVFYTNLLSTFHNTLSPTCILQQRSSSHTLPS